MKKKTALLSMKYWLLNRYPYKLVYEIILHNRVGSNLLYTLNNHGPFFIAHLVPQIHCQKIQGTWRSANHLGSIERLMPELLEGNSPGIASIACHKNCPSTKRKRDQKKYNIRIKKKYSRRIKKKIFWGSKKKYSKCWKYLWFWGCCY